MTNKELDMNDFEINLQRIALRKGDKGLLASLFLANNPSKEEKYNFYKLIEQKSFSAPVFIKTANLLGLSTQNFENFGRN